MKIARQTNYAIAKIDDASVRVWKILVVKMLNVDPSIMALNVIVVMGSPAIHTLIVIR